jgi:hypothetical protein
MPKTRPLFALALALDGLAAHLIGQVPARVELVFYISTILFHPEPKLLSS